MAEPARQLDDSPNKVYDEPTGTAASSPKPDLKALEGGRQTTEPKRGHLKEADNDTPSPEGLSQAESEPVEKQIGQGYRPASTRGRRLNIWTELSGRKKLGIGIGGGLIGSGIIAFFLLFLPALRLESYLATINQRVFGVASNAVSQRVEHLFERYMITRVIQLDRCGNKVTGYCRADYTNQGIAADLFNSWRDAKIEQKLIDQYDLKFETHKNPAGEVDRITIRRASTNEKITLDAGDIKAGRFTGGKRQFGQEINKFLSNETRWSQMMQRKSVRKYLVRKHGVKFWCFFACKTKDSVDLKALDAKTKFKYEFVKRFVYPFSGKYGFIMNCIISGGPTEPGGPCSPDELRKHGINRDDLSDEDVQKIIKQFEENPSTRLSQIVLQTLLEKIMSEEAAKTAISAIPVAGQIYFAAVVIDMFDRIDSFVQSNGVSKFAADLTSRQYLEYYVGMRSVGDELKAGVLSASEAGAVMSQFEDGGHSAEESLVYQTYANPNKTTAAFLGGKAYAVTTQPSQPVQKDPYLCANGKPIPAGELVCPEKKVTRTYTIEEIRNNPLVGGLAGALNQYECAVPKIFGHCPPGASPRTYIRPLLDTISTISNTILSPIVSTVFSAIQAIPYVGDILNFVNDKAKELFSAFFNQVFPLPVQLTSLGREKYDGLHAGGEVAASEFNKGGYTDTGQPYGLGGKLLSPQEQSDASQAYLDQQNYNNDHSGLIARVSNLDSPNSLANKFIAIAPITWSQFSHNLAVMLTKPFSGIGSIWHPAYAATDGADINAFGIPRFGYTASDLVFNADPAIYTPEHCQQLEQARQASKTEDPVSGIDEYSVSNPCLLEKVSVEAASSVFTGNDSLDQ